jgi:putative sterol carrier protein
MADQPDLLTNLPAAIEGKSDEEIVALVPGGDVDALLERLFGGMGASFSPERAAGQSATIQYDISAADAVHSWLLKVADGACAVERGAASDARITLGLALPDFLRLTAGKLDGMTAFMSGKLKVSGDMMFAPTMQGWFVRPS